MVVAGFIVFLRIVLSSLVCVSRNVGKRSCERRALDVLCLARGMTAEWERRVRVRVRDRERERGTARKLVSQPGSALTAPPDTTAPLPAAATHDQDREQDALETRCTVVGVVDEGASGDQVGEVQ